MLKKINSIFILFTAAFLISCSTKPEPLNFGKDQCEQCKMTIVDNKFGAELITDKGKIFKFDALECMLNYIKEKQLNKDNISNTLAVNTSATVNLIETEHAIFLQSFAFPSPMGEYLSAYDTRKTAEEYQKKYPGELFSWTELLERFQVKL